MTSTTYNQWVPGGKNRKKRGEAIYVIRKVITGRGLLKTKQRKESSDWKKITPGHLGK